MDYTSIGLRIKKCRKVCGLTILDLAKKLNIHHTTISRYENGHVKTITLSTMKSLADILNTTPEYLFGFETNEQTNIPVYNSIDLTNAKSLSAFIKDEQFDSNNIVLEIKDDSMAPILLPNDIAIFKLTNKYKNGDICIIKIGNNYTIKRVEDMDGGIIIKPENTKYSILNYTKKEVKIEEISIYGRLEKLIRNF